MGVSKNIFNTNHLIQKKRKTFTPKGKTSSSIKTNTIQRNILEPTSSIAKSLENTNVHRSNKRVKSLSSGTNHLLDILKQKMDVITSHSVQHHTVSSVVTLPPSNVEVMSKNNSRDDSNDNNCSEDKEYFNSTKNQSKKDQRVRDSKDQKTLKKILTKPIVDYSDNIDSAEGPLNID